VIGDRHSNVRPGSPNLEPMTGLSRRQALFGGLTLAAMAAGAPAPALADPPDPLALIGERIDALERRHNAIVGVHAVDIETGRNVGHRDAEFTAAWVATTGTSTSRRAVTTTGRAGVRSWPRCQLTSSPRSGNPTMASEHDPRGLQCCCSSRH